MEPALRLNIGSTFSVEVVYTVSDNIGVTGSLRRRGQTNQTHARQGNLAVQDASLSYRSGDWGRSRPF